MRKVRISAQFDNNCTCGAVKVKITELYVFPGRYTVDVLLLSDSEHLATNLTCDRRGRR